MSPQAGWILQEEVVPRLKASIPRNVNQVGAEDPEELIQDAIVMAAKLMHTVECQGKTVTAGNIAYYTILHMKSGRRSYGTSTTDVCGISTQLNGSTRNLDWAHLLGRLSEIEKLVVEFLCAGKTLRDVARKVGLSDSTMQSYRRKLAVKILEYMGIDVLRDIVMTPGWRINLDCEREAQACRNDRRASAAAA
jgi:hypothetical protein